jgi:hypothetical protein
MAAQNTTINYGSNIPTTYLFDVSQASTIDVNSTQFKELLVRLYQNINNIIQVINKKDTGYYLNTTFNTNQVFFNVNNDFNNLRPIYRIVVDFGALPDTTSKPVAHNIPNLGTTYTFTRIDAVATEPDTSSIHIPGWDPSTFPGTESPINIEVTPTQVIITTTSDMSSYTRTWVILEYILL